MLSQSVGRIQKLLLVGVPLEGTEESAERSLELIGIELLMDVLDLLDDCGNVLGQLCRVGKIH
jgi:hypothetical protein